MSEPDAIMSGAIESPARERPAAVAEAPATPKQSAVGSSSSPQPSTGATITNDAPTSEAGAAQDAAAAAAAGTSAEAAADPASVAGAVRGRSDSLSITHDDEIAPVSSAGAADSGGLVCNITLLLPNGNRHPFRIDDRYLTKRNVEVPDLTDSGHKDPFSISVYKLKELILREWREDWDGKPASPSSIRLIHFGKLLDDKEQLRSMLFLFSVPVVSLMHANSFRISLQHRRTERRPHVRQATRDDGGRRGRQGQEQHQGIAHARWRLWLLRDIISRPRLLSCGTAVLQSPWSG